MENIKKSFDPAQGEKEQTKIINLANPAPLGLLGFGMTTVLLNLHNADFFVLNSMVLAMGIFYGGFAQIIAGIFEWKKENTFCIKDVFFFSFFFFFFFTGDKHTNKKKPKKKKYLPYKNFFPFPTQKFPL